MHPGKNGETELPVLLKIAIFANITNINMQHL